MENSHDKPMPPMSPMGAQNPANSPVSAGGGSAGVASIIDVTTQNFIAEVIDASHHQLVLLDLWAPWCEPCKQLTPVLERLAQNSGGAVRLAKMNIDEHPEVSQQLQVQSIPAVFVFMGGRPVDSFVGVLPESEIKSRLDRFLQGGLPPSPLEQILEAAKMAAQAGDYAGAAQAYGQILQQEPENIIALAGLAQAQISVGQLEAAQQILEMVPPHINDAALDAALDAAWAALALAQKSASASTDIAALQARLAANENDHQARFDLAMAYHATDHKTEAMDSLLDIVAHAPSWNDEAARHQLVELFAAYGTQNEAVVAARRKLSSLLFA